MGEQVRSKMELKSVLVGEWKDKRGSDGEILQNGGSAWAQRGLSVG